jgi:chorismate mutase
MVMKSKREIKFELKLLFGVKCMNYTQTVLLLVGDQMGERNCLSKCLQVMIHTKANNIMSFKKVTPEESNTRMKSCKTLKSISQ